MDLYRFGRELKERRRVLGISRAELARRVGVTPAYIWLIEGAIPRKGGDPSHPSEELVIRWSRALGMDEQYTQQALHLAGYGPSQDDRSPSIATGETPAPAGILPPAVQQNASLAHAPVHYPPPPELRRDLLLQQMDDLLQRAAAAGREDEIAQLIETLVEFVRLRLAR